MKNKLILSLGSSLLVFAPVMTVVACGDDKPATPAQTDLQKADAEIAKVSVLALGELTIAGSVPTIEELRTAIKAKNASVDQTKLELVGTASETTATVKAKFGTTLSATGKDVTYTIAASTLTDQEKADAEINKVSTLNINEVLNEAGTAPTIEELRIAIKAKNPSVDETKLELVGASTTTTATIKAKFGDALSTTSKDLTFKTTTYQAKANSEIAFVMTTQLGSISASGAVPTIADLRVAVRSKNALVDPSKLELVGEATATGATIKAKYGNVLSTASKTLTYTLLTDQQKVDKAITDTGKYSHIFFAGTTVDANEIKTAWNLVDNAIAGVTWTVENLVTTGTQSATIKATAGAVSASRNITFTVTSSTPAATINMATISTPSALLAAIDDQIKVYMGMQAPELIKPENKTQFIAYTNQITAAKVIRFTDGTNNFDLDFSGVQTEVDNIKRIVQNDLHTSNTGKGSAIGMAMLNNKLMPPMAAMTEVLMGQIWSMTIAPYMELSELTYNANIGDVVQQHSYIKMLNAYHAQFDKFTKSALFKAWNVNKEYTLPKNITNADWANMKVKSGQLYDAETYPPFNGVAAGKSASNLEALFVIELLRCDEVVAAGPTATSQTPVHFGKEQLQTALPEFTNAEFSNTTYPDKLVYAPNSNGMNTVKLTNNGWIYDESMYRDTMPTSNVFIYGEPSDALTANYFIKPSVDVYSNAPIFAKYPEFTSAHLTTSGTDAPAGWFKTTNPKEAALATATVKFYSQSAKATFYRTTPLSQEYSDIISIWEPVRMVPGSTQVSTSLDVDAITALATDTWAELTNNVITSWGIANFPTLPADMKGVTLQYKFGTLGQGVVTGATGNRRTTYVSFKVTKGTTTFESNNQFRIASSVAATADDTISINTKLLKTYLAGVTWNGNAGTVTSTTTVANKPKANIAEKTLAHTDLKAATNPIMSSITATALPTWLDSPSIKYSYDASTDTITLKVQKTGGTEVVLTIVVTYTE